MTAVITGDQTNTVGLINSKTAVASTSGTSIDFTGIPAGTKRITVMFNGVSTNGSSIIQAQLGSGSFTTSGYVSGASINTTNLSSTTGLVASPAVTAADVRYGIMTITNVSGNIWVMGANVGVSSNSGTSSGYVSLSGTLDRVRITTVNGTDTFDAGSINILYE